MIRGSLTWPQCPAAETIPKSPNLPPNDVLPTLLWAGSTRVTKKFRKEISSPSSWLYQTHPRRSSARQPWTASSLVRISGAVVSDIWCGTAQKANDEMRTAHGTDPARRRAKLWSQRRCMRELRFEVGAFTLSTPQPSCSQADETLTLATVQECVGVLRSKTLHETGIVSTKKRAQFDCALQRCSTRTRLHVRGRDHRRDPRHLRLGSAHTRHCRLQFPRHCRARVRRCAFTAAGSRGITPCRLSTATGGRVGSTGWFLQHCLARCG